jgi:uncharacterized membrane protein YsdA (DUF1294 family)
LIVFAFFCKDRDRKLETAVLSFLTPDAEKRLANRDLALAHAPRSLPTLCILRYLLFKLIVFAFFCKDRDRKLETAVLSFLTPDAEKRLANRDLALAHAPRSLPTLCILRYLLFKLIVFAFFCKDRDWKLETAILSFLAPDAEKRLANRDLALPRAPRSLPTLCILCYLLFKLIVFAFFCKDRASCVERRFARYFGMQPIERSSKLLESVLNVFLRNPLFLLAVMVLQGLWATGLMAQTTSVGVRAPAIQTSATRPAVVQPSGSSVHLNSAAQYRASQANLGVTGLPAGPSQLPYPLTSTPANDAWVRNNAWAAYEANLHHIPAATNPNRLAAKQNLVDQDRFVEKPNSSHRYNFQFSDNEIRSVQAALRRMGIYSGQVDGILGPDTQRAIEDYQIRTKRPVTGQPDSSLNAALGVF